MKTEPNSKGNVTRHNLTQPEEIDLIWMNMASLDLKADKPISDDALSIVASRDAGGDEFAD
jgi:hypothetical protein